MIHCTAKNMDGSTIAKWINHLDGTHESISLKRKIYLAARYSRRDELAGYAEQLREMGYEVTSRWLNGNHQISDEGLSEEDSREERERFATEDFEDLASAGCVISFTEPPRSGNSRGGRHVEFGMAVALGHRLMVVGHRENVFHCLPRVEFYPVWASCLAALFEEVE